MSGIEVSYAALEAAGEHCDQTAATLESQFNNLKDDLKPLVTNWSGSAKDAYHQAQTQWDQSFEDLKRVLAKIGSVLPQIAASYKHADNQAGKGFGG